MKQNTEALSAISRGRRLLATIAAAVLVAVGLAACGAAGSAAAGGAADANPAEAKAVGTEWFYEKFDARQRDAYDAFRRAAEDPFSGNITEIRSEEGDTVTLPIRELDLVYQGFLYDHPEHFWLSRSYSYRVGAASAEESADAVAVIPLAGSAEELARQREEFDAAADAMIAALGAPDPGSIYDLVAGHAAYTEEALYDPARVNEHTAYGAIVLKSAVCDGFALSYKYLMNRCGFECLVIPGECEGAAHVWNTAYWDGAWHEMDLTWDASSEGGGRQYFDLSTKEMSKDHIRETEGIADLVPAAVENDDPSRKATTQ